jgi:hypothetical protein
MPCHKNEKSFKPDPKIDSLLPEFIAEYNKGSSILRIAKKYHISTDPIKQRLMRAGLPINNSHIWFKPRILRENINPVFLAWLAGFYEGEGNLNISRKPNHPTVHLSIGQSNKDILSHIQETLGAGQICLAHPAGVVKGKKVFYRKDHYTYELCSLTDVEPLLIMLKPYLRMERRAARVDEALVFIAERKEAYKRAFT